MKEFCPGRFTTKRNLGSILIRLTIFLRSEAVGFNFENW